ncbi:hypothetical protein HYFRA_00007236 [Hymenoscyphus fraxineus]|uniref:PPPDE domain-containing protein n=1 Tax=Hymenoscyphus fraxineus TaxID=746836 RepID=A0A9N9PTH8_9HELO|nr:hypothetical protein HYFRA_00007236 [Hymenoscyphus fraxineus]
MDLQGGFANSVIGDFAARHPRTLKDEDDELEPSKGGRLLGFLRLPTRPVGWKIGHQLMTVMELDQITDNLPERPESFKHVYLACVPHHAWPISFSHWSVFSQGCFYHLSAPGLGSGLTYQSGSGIDKRENVILKVENMKDQTDTGIHKKLPLILYEIGSTDYSPQEIQRIAEWVLKQMPIYDLFEKNCQVFALSMIFRTVMTKRDSSVFVGTKKQIADWDAKDLDQGAHESNRENGFLSCKEFVQDLGAGKFRSAFRGRDDLRRQEMLSSRRRIDEGDSMARFLLQFNSLIHYGSMTRAIRMTMEELEALELNERRELDHVAG